LKTSRINVLSMFLLLTALVCISCQKNIGSDFVTHERVVPITASLSGRVTDNGHLPVNGARVSIDAVTAVTDLNGYFYFKAVSIKNPDQALVKVDKEGFFMGSRTYLATSGSDEYVAVQLIRKNVAGTFPAASGGAINIPVNEGKIDFPANGIVSPQSNTAYSGTISVSGVFINPASKDFQEMMPGMLTGVSSNNARVGLQSFSMMAVELSGSGNEKLQIAAGKTATLAFPIPADLRAKAPATIPLWNFNDTTGVWKEEGLATRQGNNYIGTVSHFSVWNCAVSSPITTFKAMVTDQNKLPVSNRKVLIRMLDNTKYVCAYGYTDSAGLITANVPAGKKLEMTMYNRCGDSIHTQNIGPFSGTNMLNNITVNTVGEKVVTFSGTVVNCLGAPVASGVVSLEIENTFSYAKVVDGNFSMSISRCNVNAASAMISAFDNSSSAQGKPVRVSIAPTDALVSVGTLTACGVVENEFFEYSMYSEKGIFSAPEDSVSCNKAVTGDYIINCSRKNNQSIFTKASITFSPTSTTSTTLISARIDSSGQSYLLSQLPQVRLTENGPVGGYIAGEFSAYVHLDGTITSGTLWVRFRVKRKY
jgi:hypothetical protein